MDIVSRLKTFMQSLNIANSQFADTCYIPRPTISQILNGRNKKISDEIISKIHNAYPTLSMLWLMFGEGEMLVVENSQNQESKKHEYSDVTASIKQNIIEQKSIMRELNFDHPNNMDQPNINLTTPLNQNKHELKNNSNNIFDSHKNIPIDKNHFNTFEKKEVKHIMVFYTDNSYETFIPEKK